MPITSEAYGEMKGFEESLRPLATKLLGIGMQEFALQSTMLPKPIQVEKFVGEWMAMFTGTSGAQKDEQDGVQRDHGVIAKHRKNIKEQYDRLIRTVWESRGDWLGCRAYESIEAWLRKEALISTGPLHLHTSLTLVWFTAVIHNTLWWWYEQQARDLANHPTLVARPNGVFNKLFWWMMGFMLPPPENNKLLKAVAEPQGRVRRGVLRLEARFPVMKRFLNWLENHRSRSLENHKEAIAETEPDWSWLEDELNRDVDRLITTMEESSAVSLGDMIAMHVMAANLWRLVRPPKSARIAVRAKGSRSVSRSSGNDPLAELPSSLAARFERIRILSPFSRLCLITSPRVSEGQVKSAPDEAYQPPTWLRPSWTWIDNFFTDGVQSQIGLYLASKLGERFAQPQLPIERLVDLLTALQAMEEDVAHAATDQQHEMRAAWNHFLAQILWAALGETGTGDASAFWGRWTAGYPDHICLAQWCGRLARRVEQMAMGGNGSALPEWAWIWLDIAKVTFQRWLLGRDQFVLCLGCWLLGYLGEDGKAPPLVLARRVTEQTLEQIVGHWQRAIDAELGITSAADMANSEQHVTHLVEILRTLRTNSAFMDLLAADNDQNATVPRAVGAGYALQEMHESPELSSVVDTYMCAG